MSFRRYFQIPYQPVAVKILKEHVKATEENLRFCEAVKRAATNGERIVLDEINLICSGALVSLGFVKGVFSEESEEETKAVIVEPYKGEECDVVLIIATPDRVMKIASFYSQLFGEELRAEFSGENAVCGEATAKVKKEGRPNISFLCEGAREYAGYKREEVVIGFTYETFRRMEEAIKKEEIKSMCGCLMDDLPRDVIEKFESMGFDKATDHFFGFYNGKTVKVYIFRDTNALGLYTSVKFKSEEEAEKVVERYKGEYVLLKRENWVDVSKILEVDVISEIRKGNFEELLNSELERIVKEAKKLKSL